MPKTILTNQNIGAPLQKMHLEHDSKNSNGAQLRKSNQELLTRSAVGVQLQKSTKSANRAQLLFLSEWQHSATIFNGLKL